MLTAEPVWVDKERALHAHARALDLHGGLPGVRDETLLESALAREGVELVEKDALETLLRVRPGRIKRDLLRGAGIEDCPDDVWLLTERDHGADLPAESADLFVIALPEHSGSGYLWTAAESGGTGFRCVRDGRKGAPGSATGSHTVRSFVMRPDGERAGTIALEERRPWLADSPPLNEFRVCRSCGPNAPVRASH